MANSDVSIDDTMNDVLTSIREEEEEVENEVVETVEPETPEIEEPIVETEVEAEVEVIEPEIEPEIPEHTKNPPSTWRPAAKNKWAELDPVIRDEIKKREQDAINGSNMLKDRAEKFDSIENVMKPYEQIIRAEGGTPETVVEAMLNSAYILRQGSMQQKVQMTMQMAQQYGFINELGALLTQGVAPAQQQQPGLSPQDVERMVEQRLASQAQERETSSLVEQVEQFSSAVNEDGSLKHPYFENVRGMMASIVEANDISLADAYERAIWADPETRGVMQQHQGVQNQAKEHVENAKKAAANNLSKTPSHASEQPEPTGSVDDTLRSVMANIKARD